tara:strand:+ start:2134 stop:2403 length:270 start_codon:yes stop_codon:yes gene_type:complete
MNAYEVWKKKMRNLLGMSRKMSTFGKQASTGMKAYKNLVIQQNVLLDEYEELVKAYEENNKDADGSSTDGSVPTASARSPDTGMDDERD